jgi:hypothetical protein
MAKLPKITLLFFGFSFIVSCMHEPDCSYENERTQFSGKIKFEEYYNNDARLRTSKGAIPYIEKFTFYENETFSYLGIVYENDKNDTVKILNGKFKTYRDENSKYLFQNSKYPWHILKLSSDSIYERRIIEDTLNDSWHFSSDFAATKFLGFPDSLLVDTRYRVSSADSSWWHVDTSCFTLKTKSISDSNPCNDGFYPDFGRTFCLEHGKVYKAIANQ